MSRSPIVVRHYKEQNYSTFFNMRTGFFARIEEPGHSEPFWSWHGPELLDISITNWCDKECALCYRRSNKSGQHISLEDYEVVMRQARKMYVLQVALGGGNPNQHPRFCEILRLTRGEYGIVPNYSTNGRGLTNDVLKATSEYCGAVAVSAYHPYEETRRAIDALMSFGIKTNIHFILSSRSIGTAISWLESPPGFVSKIGAIIFLNYKPMGRCNSNNLLLKNSDRVEHFFQLAAENKHGFRIGFDACTATGLARFTNVSSVCYDGCDAGRFSMFVSENMNMYPCSFMAEAGYKGIPIVADNMQHSWRNSELFSMIRDRLSLNDCNGCSRANLCLGGCPVFHELNLCSNRQNSIEQSQTSANRSLHPTALPRL